MRVTLTNHRAGDAQEHLDGPETAVRDQLLARIPHLTPHAGRPLPDLLALLNHGQVYSAAVSHEPQAMAKAEPRLDPYRAAAALSGRPGAPPGALRAALWEADGDHELAALRAQGLDPGQLRALRAWVELGGKRPPAPDEPVEPPTKIEAATPTGEEARAAVQRAFAARQVRRSTVAGAHSAGTLLATDSQTGKAYRLKPGAGPSPGPAVGDDQDPAGQSEREVAFWYGAKEMGLAQYVPRAELLVLDGHRVACIEALPRSFRLLRDLLQDDPNAGRRLLRPYLHRGTIHRWGAMLYVLADPDCNSGNLMADTEQVRLIDHGSAFAGSYFDPPRDRMTFVPYFLRAWHPGAFNTAPMDQKLRYMPRLGRADEQLVGGWLRSLDPDRLQAAVAAVGVDAAPVLDRLDRLRARAERMPADSAINESWVVPEGA